MSKAARSIYVWGIYVTVTGLALIFIPNVVFGLIGLPTTNEVWIRALGVMALILAYYYFVAVKGDFVPLYRASIYARLAFIVASVLFVVLGMAKVNFLLFAVFDALGSLWTFLALRQE